MGGGRVEPAPAGVAAHRLQHPGRTDEVGERRGEGGAGHADLAEWQVEGVHDNCVHHAQVDLEDIPLDRRGEREADGRIGEDDEQERGQRPTGDRARRRHEVRREIGAREDPGEAGEDEDEHEGHRWRLIVIEG